MKVIANAAKTATPVLKKYRKIYITFLALIIRRRWTSDVLNVHFQEKYVVYQSSHVTGSPYKYRFVSVRVWLPLVVWVSVSGLVTGEGIKKKKEQHARRQDVTFLWWFLSSEWAEGSSLESLTRPVFHFKFYTVSSHHEVLPRKQPGTWLGRRLGTNLLLVPRSLTARPPSSACGALRPN